MGVPCPPRSGTGTFGGPAGGGMSGGGIGLISGGGASIGSGGRGKSAGGCSIMPSHSATTLPLGVRQHARVAITASRLSESRRAARWRFCSCRPGPRDSVPPAVEPRTRIPAWRACLHLRRRRSPAEGRLSNRQPTPLARLRHVDRGHRRRPGSVGAPAVRCRPETVGPHPARRLRRRTGFAGPSRDGLRGHRARPDAGAGRPGPAEPRSPRGHGHHTRRVH